MNLGTVGTVGIVGGGGFIGSHVVDAVEVAGGTPIVIGQDNAPRLDCEVRITDASDLYELVEALKGCTSVIHLAARAGGIQMQHDDDIYHTNRRITDNVLMACTERAISDVFLGSSQVVYRDADRPIIESDPIVSGVDYPTQYAWSKATDEVVGRWWQDSNNARVVIGRFGNVYGPGASYAQDRWTVVHALIARFVSAEPGSVVDVWGDGSAVRSFVYVEDAARAVVTILRFGHAGAIYNVDSGQAVTIRELATALNDLIGNELILEFDRTKPVGVGYRVGSVESIKAIGFEPRTDLMTGLAATIDDYLRRHPRANAVDPPGGGRVQPG